MEVCARRWCMLSPWASEERGRERSLGCVRGRRVRGLKTRTAPTTALGPFSIGTACMCKESGLLDRSTSVVRVGLQKME